MEEFFNFGSGHLEEFHSKSILKNEVINFEYDKSLKNYENYFMTIDKFNNIEDNFDLIYASHSLEHVSDIDTIINHFKRNASPNCKLFF